MLRFCGLCVSVQSLQRLRAPQNDVAVRVDNAGCRLVDERPRSLSDFGALPQLDEPAAATRSPKIVPDASGDMPGIVIGPPP
jgi:hypothetical protein